MQLVDEHAENAIGVLDRRQRRVRIGVLHVSLGLTIGFQHAIHHGFVALAEALFRIVADRGQPEGTVLDVFRQHLEFLNHLEQLQHQLIPRSY